jgi:hypothetical protein
MLFFGRRIDDVSFRSNITQIVTKQTAENTSQIGVLSIILLTSPEAVPVTEGPSKSNSLALASLSALCTVLVVDDMIFQISRNAVL